VTSAIAMLGGERSACEGNVLKIILLTCFAGLLAQYSLYGPSPLIGTTSFTQEFPNGTSKTTAEGTFANESKQINTTWCVIATGACETTSVWEYPFLGDCFFTNYRLRWWPSSTDAFQVPLLKEIKMLSADGEAIYADKVALEGADYPDVSSAAEYGSDNLNTSWFDPHFKALLLSYILGVSAAQVCIELADPSRTTPFFSIEGAHDAAGPWIVQIPKTAAEVAEACYNNEHTVECEEVAEEKPPQARITLPEHFQLLEKKDEAGNPTGEFMPVQCPEYGTCLSLGCAEYHVGPLCHQCAHQMDGTDFNGTRLRDGELCDACPLWWVPWVKLVFFYLFGAGFFGTVIYLGYRAGIAPMFSPANQARIKANNYSARAYRKKHGTLPEDEPPEIDEMAELEAKSENTITLSPLLAAALLRAVLDHHTLCSIAWDYSGFALAFPKDYRHMAFAINMDWWSILSMQCASYGFLVDDVLWFGATTIPVNLIIFVCIYFPVVKDVCGIMASPEQQLLQDKEALEEAFARIDRDSDGKLTKEEIWEAIKPPDELARLAGPRLIVLCGVLIFQYLQVPLFQKAFTNNLDCAMYGTEKAMRIDLRHECSGPAFEGRVSMSCICLLLWSFGTPVACWISIWWARKSTHPDEGQDYESAFTFFVAGLRDQCWWFGIYKILLKELIPLVCIVNRSSQPIVDPGVTAGPGLLCLFGALATFMTEQLEPFDFMYGKPLTIMERLSWTAFMAGPACRFLVGYRTEVVGYMGEFYHGTWSAEASKFFDWIALYICLILYFAPFFAAAFFLVDEEFGWTKVATVNIEVAERVHVTMPAKGRERKQVAWTLSKLFEHGLLMCTRQSEETEEPVIAPASIIEGALLIVMREDAAFWGDANPGSHAILNVEHESFLSTISLLQRDRERRDMGLARAILDAGGLAETCLRQGFEVPGLQAPSADPIGASEGAHVMTMAGNFLDAHEAKMVISMFFAIENVELRSLGFKEGERHQKVRQGVQDALERGVAVAVACQKNHIKLEVHPVGVDRAVVTVGIRCDGEADLSTREEWLRTSLGTREARNRWGKGLEADLARVGVVSTGTRLAVRFNKGSKPTRMTEEGAAKMALTAVKAAAIGPDWANVVGKGYETRSESGSNSGRATSGVGTSYRGGELDNIDEFDPGGMDGLADGNRFAGMTKAVKKTHQSAPLSGGREGGSRRKKSRDKAGSSDI